jgi:hypothetical protein
MKHVIAFLWMLLVLLSTSGACFQSDVRALCCPSACAVKSSPKWSEADQVLRSCMRGLGCNDSESKGASVAMKCSCPRGNP